MSQTKVKFSFQLHLPGGPGGAESPPTPPVHGALCPAPSCSCPRAHLTICLAGRELITMDSKENELTGQGPVGLGRGQDPSSWDPRQDTCAPGRGHPKDKSMEVS